MQNDLSRRAFIGRLTNTAVGAAIVSVDLTACAVDKARQSGIDPSRSPPKPTPTPTTPTKTATVFDQLKIGGGGFVTGIDVSADGSMRVIRCDTFGAYKWDAATSSWLPLLTSTSMPAGEFGPDVSFPNGAGAYEVAVAPNAPKVIYVAFNGLIYRTVDGGTTFTRTGFEKQQLDSNDAFRYYNRKMAVDPATADAAYVGTQKGGLWRTVNGGASWAAARGVPAATSDAGVLVAIDPSSPLVSGRRSVVYAISNGHGVYRSADGGETFVLLEGSPKKASKLTCGPDGSVFVTDWSATCYRYRRGAWSTSTINSYGSWHTVAVNPTNANHVVIGGDAGHLRISFDGGVTFAGTMRQSRAAADVPWLAWTNENYMSSGDIVFDPANPGSLLFAQGIGVWDTTSLAGRDVEWQSRTRGIEQLVTNTLLSPPGGPALMFVWDRGLFAVADPAKYATKHAPTREKSIVHGWHGDYAAPNPKFVAGIVNSWGNEYSGYSTDGGETWTQFATLPEDVKAGKIAGSMAVASDRAILWSPSNNAAPWVTRDRGASWQRVELPGIPSSGETGWGWAYYLNRRIVAADRVEPDTFYMYNYLRPNGGVFRSRDAGVTWERMFAGPLSTWSTFNAKMRSVPDRAGHLFFAEGPQDGANPANSPFKQSTDGGRTWRDIPDVLEVSGFGFGKPQVASDYPALFIVGYVKGKYGVHVSNDEARTWTMLTEYPNGNFDRVSCVEGDMNVVGRVYVGFSGSGASYGELRAV